MKKLTFKEFLVEGTEFEKYKKHKVPLTDEERKICFDRKAVWNNGPNRSEIPAVWKSVIDGKPTYITNTHRAWRKSNTLKGAIKEFHDFIKGTA